MKKVSLFINYYIDKNEKRQEELNACLNNNIKNKYIHNIFILHDSETRIPTNNKIIGITVEKRPKYTDFIDCANKIDGIKIISNSDIYFDDSLKYVQNIKDDEAYALCRWCLRKDGSIEFLNSIGSQDTWIYSGAVKGIDVDYGLGKLGCLSGDTIVQYKRGKRDGNRSLKLSDLYKRFNYLDNHWKIKTETYLQSFNNEENNLIYNNIISVVESGVKEVLKITFDNNEELKLTKDHKILKEDKNFYRADKLNIGDFVISKGLMQPTKFKDNKKINRKRKVVYLNYHPFPEFRKVNGKIYKRVRVKRSKLVYEANLNNMSFSEFVNCLRTDEVKSKTLIYITNGDEIHHKDNDTLNDTIENLELLSKKEHCKKHIRKNQFNLQYIDKRRIVKIENAGEEMTYDIQMKFPYNNFSANGIIVHNCDQSIFYELKKAGRNVLSPSLGIKSIHYHLTNIRNYTEKDVTPTPYAYADKITSFTEAKDYKILFKFPVRGRKEKLFSTLEKYYNLKGSNPNFKFIISMDNDDKELNTKSVKNKLDKYENLTYFYGDNKTKVQAINADIPSDGYDIIVLVSDDMIPVENGFDDIIREQMSIYFNDTDGVLYFNDGSANGHVLNTLCILGASYYNRFQYIYNQEYKSLRCDVEFTHVAWELKKQMYFSKCIIRHEHPAWGFGKDDELYIKAAKDFDYDNEIFKKRMDNDFKDTIPKRAFFIWSKGTPLSYLRYLTLVSFRELHPDYSMILYLAKAIEKKNWDGREQQEYFNENKSQIKDYLPLLSELKVEVREYNKYDNLNPTQIADIFRFEVLHEYGGWFFDLDQLFLNRIPDEMLVKNTFVFGCESINYIGVIGAIRGCKECKDINNIQLDILNNKELDDYQTLGIHILDKYVKGGNLTDKALITKDEVFYPVLHSDSVGCLHDGSLDFSELNNTIACHWYAGHPLSQVFNFNYTEESFLSKDDSFSRYLRGKLNVEKSEMETVFTEIVDNNTWGDGVSLSGSGSDYIQTEIIRSVLPILFKDFNIKTFLDAPCGDFFWMRKVDLSEVNYIGVDIVDDILKLAKKHESSNISFKKIDIMIGDLPKADLMLCRDCLVHFSFDDIFKALDNIKRCGIKYLLTTSFIDRTVNNDINTGEWRPINLEIAPFYLKNVIHTINEGCTEGNGAYSDKSLILIEL